MERKSVRGIIFEGNKLYVIFRRKNIANGFKEYYVIPGGGIEEGENLEECLVRELKEELSIDVKVKGYLGTENNDYFYRCEILNGIPTLGGEELEKNSDDNYYEIQLLDLSSLDNVDILYKDIIIKAYNKQYINQKISM